MKQIYLSLFLMCSVISIQAQKNKVNLIVGTYTNSCDSKGVYVCEFDTDNAQIKLKSTSDNVANPSYLSVSKDEKFIYAVNESGANSMVSSFAFDRVSGKTNLINTVSSKGADPCYIINDDKNVIVANYSGGNISVFGKNQNGSLTEAKQVIQHYGKGPNAERQEKAHAHMVYFSPDKKYVLCNDLGTDKVYLYGYNPAATADVLLLKDSVSVKAGSGPRHLVFSKDGKYVYLLQELDGSLTTFGYAEGKLTQISETSILAKNYKGAVGSADIHITPNGKFLYASNRGDANTISIFEILEKGKLKSKGQVSTLGKGPRNFAIDPTGKFLLVAHQKTNNIVIFKIDEKNGALTDTGKRFDLCSPVCLVFAR